MPGTPVLLLLVLDVHWLASSWLAAVGWQVCDRICGALVISGSVEVAPVFMRLDLVKDLEVADAPGTELPAKVGVI